MASVLANSYVTPEDLLQLPDGEKYELVGGVLVERNVSFQSSYVGGQLLYRLAAHCEPAGLGWVLPSDLGYRCFADAPGKVRRADASFIAAGRVSEEETNAGFCRIAPDLAVEVTSPHDLMSEVFVKVNEYLTCGVKLIWVIDSETGRTLVFRANGRGSILTRDDELDGEEVIPGFRCRIAELFAPPGKGTAKA
jgi:Uma2 family endonuclease